MQRHYDGSPRHSMSRGEPRIKDPIQYEIAQIGAAILLLGFAAPLGVLFIISRISNAMLMSKQQEALMARYLDAIDAQIETQYLESALLGETEPEVTYLYQQLSKSIPGEMRKNIAAAAAGSPVKIVAQAPRALPVAVAR